MARFMTDLEGWVIEVEHLETDGDRKLTQLASTGRPDGNRLRFTVSARTGSQNRSQYFIEGLNNGTYAVQVRVRDTAAPNVFRYDVE